MDSEELTAEELEAKRRVYAHLAQGAADVKAGVCSRWMMRLTKSYANWTLTRRTPPA